ncbi:Predicted membrane protein [Plasmopara halstedii]|uniref:Predicted membrane protein n=1 Tax=Plasmopara halstedii TaxID=4781 RepID=A0A0P1A610_PLAHL|nr:Predicted membrane protein [Plasmopara halstedii]CEG35569.1 Predicted membrane protein [Plasmopara halstedii]|eukprot:XP_024571938.1 Predicted membrane protein [Plasmopara halstedii]
MELFFDRFNLEKQPLIELPQFLNSLPFGQYMIPNYSAVVVSIYMFWYIALDRVAGTFGAIIVFLCYVLANFLVVEGVTFMKASIAHVALAIIVLGFILQFIGHGVFEHRKPALFDGPGQALITAPMFVLLEIMFSLGYRPELHQRIVKQMQKNIRNSSSLKTI